MPDFTSALYLGFEHASWSLPGWQQLTLGKPGALEALPGNGQVEEELAALTGCERVVLGTSTLHLFCDLFAMLAKRAVAIWIDEAAYPIASWGAGRAAVAGVPVRFFPAHDPAALRRAIESGRRAAPVIVTDGFSPLRGRPAPLLDYAACAAAADGLLIVDDTQALGVLGRDAGGSAPYGSGGGGSLRYFDLREPHVVVVSSLAKAFGAPLAMFGGPAAAVKDFRENSGTLVHSSPPSAAAVAAARRALEINRRFGDRLRCQLAAHVLRFRRAVPGLVATRSLFPVQPLMLPRNIDVRAVYRDLLANGVHSVLNRDPCSGSPRISFVLSARHRPTEIDRAVEALLTAVERQSPYSERRNNVSRTF